MIKRIVFIFSFVFVTSVFSATINGDLTVKGKVSLQKQLNLSDKTAVETVVIKANTSTYAPSIRYSATLSQWQYSNDGVNWYNFGSGGSGSGASTFLDLTDTPSSYSGQAGKYIKVNSGETGLEFTTISGGSGTPGGNNKTIQYNNNGSFAGDDNLTWDSSLKQLTISGETKSETVTVTGSVLALPVLSSKPSPPPSGKVYIYYRNGAMYYQDETGTETKMCETVIIGGDSTGTPLSETDIVFNFNGTNGDTYTSSNPNYGRVRKGEVNNWAQNGDCYIDTDTKKYGTGSLYTDGMGKGMYIQNPSGFDLLDDEWCWEFWAKIYDAASIPEQTVITCGMGGQYSLSRDVYQIVIVYDSSEDNECFKIRFVANKNNSQIAYYETENLWGSYTPTDWNHFAIERDKSHSPQLRVFVNGTEVTVNQTTAFSNSIETTGRLQIGASGDEVSSFYGWIDDVRFRRSKPYTSNFTPPGEW